MTTFLTLFLEFFKVGLFSVGGGLATIPFLREMAQNHPWFSLENLSDMIAVSESTPGPIGVNMATYAGYMAGFDISGVFTGILGGVVATLGIITPAVVIICIISCFMEKFKTNKYVEYAFYGIRPAVSGLILGAMASIFVSAIFVFGQNGNLQGINVISAVLYAVMTAVYAKFNKLHPVVIIAVGAVMGIIFKL